MLATPAEFRGAAIRASIRIQFAVGYYLLQSFNYERQIKIIKHLTTIVGGTGKISFFVSPKGVFVLRADNAIIHATTI